MERLRRVRQLTTVQDYLIRFRKAAAECRNLGEEEKTNAVAKSLRTETGEPVYLRRPRNMKVALQDRRSRAHKGATGREAESDPCG